MEHVEQSPVIKAQFQNWTSINPLMYACEIVEQNGFEWLTTKPSLLLNIPWRNSWKLNTS